MDEVTLLVIAKEPRPGHVKTRLSPPFSLGQAATLAGAALHDTLDVVASTPVRRKLLVFDGDHSGWTRAGFDVIPQQGQGLGERLERAFAQVEGPALLVGMDTPQLTSALLGQCIRALEDPDVDAVIGPTWDGGYWSVGLARPTPAAFWGVPMSASDTHTHQRERFRALGLRVGEQSWLRDVDTAVDAFAVAREAPQSRFASAVAAAAAGESRLSAGAPAV